MKTQTNISNHHQRDTGVSPVRGCLVLLSLTFFLTCVYADQPTTRFIVPKPSNIITTQQWGSTPDSIPDSRKQIPHWITIHHAGETWWNNKDPAEFVRNTQQWGKKRP